jgi:hypothetical protein
VSCEPLNGLSPIKDPEGIKLPGFGKGINIGGNLPTIDFEKFAGPLEDLMDDLFNKLNFQVPSGKIDASLSTNKDKEILDAVLSLIDKFTPFLMFYKMFLAVLKIIACIIEVICALMNPFSLMGAVCKLFSECIPEFISIFPPFALIVMIISLIKLIITLIKYLIKKIEDLINRLKNNLTNLARAMLLGNTKAMNAIIAKLGDILCIIRRIMTAFGPIATIIDIIKQILKYALGFPCAGGGGGDDMKPPPASDLEVPADGAGDPNWDGQYINGYGGCCTPENCPGIIRKSPLHETAGCFLQIKEKKAPQNPISIFIRGLGVYGNVDREQSFQIYDRLMQDKLKWFINLVDPQDDWFEGRKSKPVFFPMDQVFTKECDIQQVPYLVDVKVLYNPAQWRPFYAKEWGTRHIWFKDCIVRHQPTTKLAWLNDPPGVYTGEEQPKGVLFLTGGYAVEDLNGDMVNNTKYTLEEFLQKPVEPDPQDPFGTPLYEYEGMYWEDQIEYHFRPNFEYLFAKAIIPAGCHPSIRAIREYYNNTIGQDLIAKYHELNGTEFPDIQPFIDYVLAEVDVLRNDLTPENADKFQANVNTASNNLIATCNQTLKDMIRIGFNRYKSTVELIPLVQWTTRKIKVKIVLNDGTGNSLIEDLDQEVSDYVISLLQVSPQLGLQSGDITYDGKAFYTYLASTNPGKSYLTVAFDSQFITKQLPPTTPNGTPTLDYKYTYEFIAGTSGGAATATGGAVENKPERDDSDNTEGTLE